MNRSDKEVTIFDAKGATGVGTALNVSDYRHISVSIATDGGGDAALTVKCQGSIAETAPTWGSAQSVTNMWDFVGMYDYNPATLTTGDTGFVVATADDYKNYTINIDGLKWINFQVTARTEGEVTIKVRPFTNG